MREAQHAAEERIREAAQEKLKDVEGSLHRIGEVVTEAAKEEAKRQNLGGFGKTSSSDQPGPDPTGRKQRQPRAKSSSKTSIRKPRAARQSDTKSSPKLRQRRAAARQSETKSSTKIRQRGAAPRQSETKSSDQR